jgi:hypothetical protein
MGVCQALHNNHAFGDGSVYGERSLLGHFNVILTGYLLHGPVRSSSSCCESASTPKGKRQLARSRFESKTLLSDDKITPSFLTLHRLLT